MHWPPKRWPILHQVRLESFEALCIAPVLARLRCLASSSPATGQSQFRALKADPAHPSLQFKPILDDRFYSVRIGLHFRALGIPVPGGIQWFWIGSHADYDRLIG